MKLSEIRKKFGPLEIYEQRKLNEEYCELVFYAKHMEQWEQALTEVFGPVAKPSGTKPSREHLLFTKEFGGIQPNQILFVTDFQEVKAIAMLWPWQDQMYITLKIAFLKE